MAIEPLSRGAVVVLYHAAAHVEGDVPAAPLGSGGARPPQEMMVAPTRRI
jgi:hypothetical protein